MILNTNYNVSVVIPTLGGNSLRKTIENLNCGSIIPNEILICIPKEFLYRVKEISYENVKIISTNFKGQVAQRALGFTLVKNNYVLQLDDDIQLDTFCLQKLIETLGTQTKVAVAPRLIDNITKNISSYMSKPTSSSGLLYKFLFYIINGKLGYQTGKISKAGVTMGFIQDYNNAYNVDWLPGGCILHLRDNLIYDNYYPYIGKAYAEDLFHSFLLKRNKISLLYCTNTFALLDNSSSKSNGIISLFKIFFSYSRIMLRFSKFSNSNRFRMLIFLFFYHYILIKKKLFNK